MGVFFPKKGAGNNMPNTPILNWFFAKLCFMCSCNTGAVYSFALDIWKQNIKKQGVVQDFCTSL